MLVQSDTRDVRESAKPEAPTLAGTPLSESLSKALGALKRDSISARLAKSAPGPGWKRDSISAGKLDAPRGALATATARLTASDDGWG